MIRFPNCKINIGLYITGKRADGFHSLETVFYPIYTLHDALEVVPAAETRLHLSGKSVAGNVADNLVWRAYNMLRAQYPQIPALDIYLLKAIPMGAGLGGGSADGAFMLQLLNDYCNLELSADELTGMALKLGSDCPFFMYNRPVFAKGRGEDMMPLPLDLSQYSLQLVCPDVHVATAKAFGMITPQAAAYGLENIASLPLAEWKDTISNDFEASIFALYPVLADIKKQLYRQGAIYAAMSGSGSTVYGIFPKGKRAEIDISTSFEEFYAT